MRLTRGTATVFVPFILLLTAGASRAAVTLDALGLYLAKNGYGGAQLVHLGNFYHLPIQSNGKPANLIVDTGSPTTLIFRSSLKRLDLIESKTTDHVSGVYGRGRDIYGLTTIKALTAGNCTLNNIPVSVVSDSSFSRPRSNGLLGLRELVKWRCFGFAESSALSATVAAGRQRRRRHQINSRAARLQRSAAFT